MPAVWIGLEEGTLGNAANWLICGTCMWWLGPRRRRSSLRPDHRSLSLSVACPLNPGLAFSAEPQFRRRADRQQLGRLPTGSFPQREGRLLSGAVARCHHRERPGLVDTCLSGGEPINAAISPSPSVSCHAGVGQTRSAGFQNQSV